MKDKFDLKVKVQKFRICENLNMYQNGFYSCISLIKRVY